MSLFHSFRSAFLAGFFAFFAGSQSPLLPHANAESPRWKSETLPVKLDVGYAVRALDLSGDGKLDIAIVDSKRIVWLENPSWNEHVIYSTPNAKSDNVCFAPHDIDGDGKVDFAIGHDWQPNNTKSGGMIGWIQSPQDPRRAWTYYPIDESPTTHRMNWMDLNRDGKQELVVAPLKGKNTVPPGFDQHPVELLQFTPPEKPNAFSWHKSVLHEETHVMHNFQTISVDDDSDVDMLLASYEGVSWLEWNSGAKKVRKLGAGFQEGPAPRLGSSEVRLGVLADRSKYVATIEPWHGDQVVVYRPNQGVESLWSRDVIDRELKWGHAVACANLDQDTDEELVIGVRDNAEAPHRCGVRVYDLQGSKWNRVLIEPGQVAVEDLVVADLNGDGKQDIIAVGRATHNAVVYWNE